MQNLTPGYGRSRLILLLGLLLSVGFFATTLFGYFVSRQAIRDTIIGQDLPLTSNNIYSEIQKDLVRPILISSTMAHDTFVRDWVVSGERTQGEMARYLREVKERHGAFSSFFVSERTGNYYTADGVLKQVSPQEPRDRWYYRVREMKEDYEINVDLDMANQDAMTIFINYRAFDFNGKYIGATGIGLTVDSVRKLIGLHQERFKRTIYFVDEKGQIVLFGQQSGRPTDLRQLPGLAPQLDKILRDKAGSFQFEAGGDNHILNVNYVPELKWYLFVEQNEDVALAEIRHTLYINLGISLAVTLVVLYLTQLVINHYQRRIEEMAATDKLTGLYNRHACAILLDRLQAAQRRQDFAVSLLLVDIDHFKSVNDRYGHRAGDDTLAAVAHALRDGLRDSDIAVRWGGEEFLLVLRECQSDEAERIAQGLCTTVANLRPCPDIPPLQVTISIGVAALHASDSLEIAVSHADDAMYQAKTSGRNQVKRFKDASDAESAAT